MMSRRVFYSFHYEADSWRVGTVRNMGVIEGSEPTTDNDWETVKKGGDVAIKRWINGQLRRRTCTVVLVGTDTAGRKWIDYEIEQSWKRGMGVAAIHVNGLKDRNRRCSAKGENPFVRLRPCGVHLYKVAKCYTPRGHGSQKKYAWIRNNIAEIVEEAICIRGQYW